MRDKLSQSQVVELVSDALRRKSTGKVFTALRNKRTTRQAILQARSKVEGILNG